MIPMPNDSETLAKGQQVITACAFIHQKIDGVEKLFLAKRATTKKFLPGIFELPGGHIDFGEDIVEGLKREILEELEMAISVGDPFFVYTYDNDIKGAHAIEVIYFAKMINPIADIKINPADHSEYRWISEDQIDQIIEGKKDDPEIEALHKAFQLLKGDSLIFD